MSSLILASGSPRRKLLLEWAEIKFDIVVSDTDESYPSSMPVNEVPVFIAKQKALAVQMIASKSEIYKSHTCIIAADTVVVLDNNIIGKPSDREDAINTLGKLSGKTHKVITGVCLLHENKMEQFSETTIVEFHELTNSQTEYYVDHYKPYDKAGAYAIQEWIGVIGIKSIQGDFYNVMGLPVSKLVQKIKQLGIH